MQQWPDEVALPEGPGVFYSVIAHSLAFSDRLECALSVNHMLKPEETRMRLPGSCCYRYHSPGRRDLAQIYSTRADRRQASIRILKPSNQKTLSLAPLGEY
jgi:hypothetical protein